MSVPILTTDLSVPIGKFASNVDAVLTSSTLKGVSVRESLQYKAKVDERERSTETGPSGCRRYRPRPLSRNLDFPF